MGLPRPTLASTFGHLLSTASSLQILVILPLTLEVAGRQTFLALSACLAFYYFIQGSINLVVKRTRLAWLRSIAAFTQILVIPAILLACLNVYSSTIDNPASPTATWLHSFVFAVPGVWESVLRYTSPFFIFLEGLSTLLVIQASGQISRYFIEERNENYSIVFLIASAVIYVASAFFLVDSYQFASATPINATFIGVSITSVIFMSGIAFLTQRSSVVETSLMMAYTTFQIYYLSAEGPDPLYYFKLKDKAALPIFSTFTALFKLLSRTFGQAIDFILAASSTLPFPVLVGLVYRIAIMSAASKVVLAVKRAQSYDDEEGGGTARKITDAVIAYGRLIMICVYTHLLLLNNEGHTVFWRWLNIFFTVLMWGVELAIAKDSDETQDSVVRGFRLKTD